MKTGIVKIPDEVKVVFKLGVEHIFVDGIVVFKDCVDHDGEEAYKSYYIDEDSVSGWKSLRVIPESWIEIQEPEIGWSRVEVDAPIEIWNEQHKKWVPIHFYKYEEYSDLEFGLIENVCYFLNGTTSHTVQDGCCITSKKNVRFPQGVNPEDHYKKEKFVDLSDSDNHGMN